MNIRLGNDIPISWEITRKGIPEDLTGKKLTLMMHVALQTFVIKDFLVEGNTVKWIFSGKDQTVPGQYRFTLIVNDGEKNMFTVDACSALTLTLSSCCESAGSEVSINSDIMLPSNGLSAYEIAVANGFVGTEEEWLTSIKQPALDAAETANNAATDCNATNESVKQAEAEREAAESTREKSENTRIASEDSRVAAEQQRVAAFSVMQEESSAATQAANSAALLAQENVLALDFEQDSGTLSVLVGADNTAFESGEIQDNGDVVLTFNYN